MIIRNEQFHENNLEKELLPLLKDKIFHLTSSASLQNILKCKFIISNKNHHFPYTFPQSENSYGRKRGFVCLFDLREKSDLEIKNTLGYFNFLGSCTCGNELAYLILKDSCYNLLISNETAVSETNYCETFIAKTECWYKGNLPIENIAEVIKVSIQRNQKDDFEKMKKLISS